MCQEYDRLTTYKKQRGRGLYSFRGKSGEARRRGVELQLQPRFAHDSPARRVAFPRPSFCHQRMTVISTIPPCAEYCAARISGLFEIRLGILVLTQKKKKIRLPAWSLTSAFVENIFLRTLPVESRIQKKLGKQSPLQVHKIRPKKSCNV